MRNEYISRIGAKRLGLHGGSVNELRGRNADRRNSAGFEIREVMLHSTAQEPQSASPSMTTLTSPTICWRNGSGAGLATVGFM